MAAIEAGAVTKTNVIGIRKAINHVERLRHGWSGNRSNVTAEEADTIEAALKAREPRVAGELFLSGLDILESPRWRDRFTGNERDIIEDLDVIKLVRFDRFGRNGEYSVPVYRALGRSGDSFLYRNIPWQSAHYNGEQSGPVVVEE